MIHPRSHAGLHRVRRSRGVTLVELLIAIALVGMLTGGVVVGMGAVTSARLKRSASMVTGAVRVGYNYANANSRPARLVFDFDARTVTLEETQGVMLLHKSDKTGGAMSATEAEQEAEQAADTIEQGPRAPKPSFQAVRTLGLADESDAAGRTLSEGIRFRQIEVDHEDEPVTSGRAYLYFWPGGQTERASVQLMFGKSADTTRDDDVLTLLVSPLTGKVQIEGGPVDMARPRSDDEESDREDTGH